jgi:hypothetical protein
MFQGDTCCWICQKCQDFEFMVDKFTCEDCGNGNWPNDNKTSCFELPMNVSMKQGDQMGRLFSLGDKYIFLFGQFF